MKTYLHTILKNKKQGLMLTVICLLASVAVNAQDTLCKNGVDTVPCRFCNVKLARPYKIKWMQGPFGFTAPNAMEFQNLVVAAAQAWNAAWTAAGKPGILLELAADTVPQCSCILGQVLCPANFDSIPPIPPIRRCDHGIFKDVVSICRDMNNLGANSDLALRIPYYPDDTDSTADYEALAVTFSYCNKNKCLDSADICVETAFAKNCTVISWFIEVNNLAMLYVNHTKGNIPRAKFDMFSVLVHELGHYLGLGHSLDKKDVMYGSIDLGETRRRPNRKEVMQIRPCVCECEKEEK